MENYLDGLRKMFGLGSGQSLRGNQLEQQEQKILNPAAPQLRSAPIQPAAQPTAYDAGEAERAERERLLQIELERLRTGQ